MNDTISANNPAGRLATSCCRLPPFIDRVRDHGENPRLSEPEGKKDFHAAQTGSQRERQRLDQLRRRRDYHHHCPARQWHELLFVRLSSWQTARATGQGDHRSGAAWGGEIYPEGGAQTPFRFGQTEARQRDTRPRVGDDGAVYAAGRDG